MPRQRKPPEQRRHRGTRDIGIVSPREGAVPRAPTEWSKETKKAWRGFWKSSVASVLDEKADMPAVIRLFSLYDEREHLAPLVRATPLVKGSQGQLRPNPLVAHIGQLDAGITALEDRFGMSPKARLQTGMQVEKPRASEAGPRGDELAAVRRLRAVDPKAI